MKGYSIIGLDNPKNRLNVGSVLRAAHCYNSTMIAISGSRVDNYRLKSIPTDTPKAIRRIPVLLCDELRDVIPYDCQCVAVDLIEGATSLKDFSHPDRAFYIFGAEDSTLGKMTLEYCQHKVFIPTNYCMNLAATVNVVLYDRLSKQSKTGEIK